MRLAAIFAHNAGNGLKYDAIGKAINLFDKPGINLVATIGNGGVSRNQLQRLDILTAQGNSQIVTGEILGLKSEFGGEWQHFAGAQLIVETYRRYIA